SLYSQAPLRSGTAMSSEPNIQYDPDDFDFSDEGVDRFLAHSAAGYDPDDFDFSDDGVDRFLAKAAQGDGRDAAVVTAPNEQASPACNYHPPRVTASRANGTAAPVEEQ